VKTIFVHVKCALGRAYDVAAEIADNVEGVSEVIPYQANMTCC
jgi:hypothetical protein